MAGRDAVIQSALAMLGDVIGGARIESHPHERPSGERSGHDRPPPRTFMLRARQGRVGLAMIVRNEAAVINRCLDSVIHLIDTWTVVDTGSVDGTQAIIRDRLAHLPGQLFERPWRDFAANRNELLDLAGGTADHLLLLDADIEVVDEGFDPDQLELDAHEVMVRGGIEYRMPYIVRSDAQWYYSGRTHEYLTSVEPLEVSFLATLAFHHHADGGSRGEKFERDRRVLEEELRERPDDKRALFYLAQTRQGLGDAAGALAAYHRRIELGGWAEEVFWSLYQCGRVLDSCGEWAHAAQAYLWAWEYSPTRAEPLFRLVQGCRARSMHHIGWLFAERVAELAVPDDRLFVERWVYEWGIDFERSILSWWVGQPELAMSLTERLLTRHDVDDSHRVALISNEAFYRASAAAL